MSPASLRSDRVTCLEVVELVTDYLERALTIEQGEAIDGHLDECEGCAVYYEQVRTTLRMLRVLSRNQAPLGGTEGA